MDLRLFPGCTIQIRYQIIYQDTLNFNKIKMLGIIYDRNTGQSMSMITAGVAAQNYATDINKIQ